MATSNLRRRLIAALLASFIVPLKAWAARWNQQAFEAPDVAAAKQALAMHDVYKDQDHGHAQIEIVAPEFAENGAVVQVEIMSRIANTTAIALFAPKNPVPLIANFSFANGGKPFLITRVKLAESQTLEVVVQADGKYYQAERYIAVSEGGCG